MGAKSKRYWSGWVHYDHGWNGYDEDGLHVGFVGDDHTEALHIFEEKVSEMRGAGASSPIRLIEMYAYDAETDTPPLLAASYFDAEQELTEEETYVARVHGWHANVDKFNDNATRNGNWWRMGYPEWDTAHGQLPDSWRYCQILWMRLFQATSVAPERPPSFGVMSMGR
ncbi:hypothetical protein ACIRRA_40285, partial [Nocardia sp. NPDC101769]|uniref:hypothetical protein n=1 Tax=Nocardia sp. NPDC101769 TaxID=3364333 RepID=UPI0038214063